MYGPLALTKALNMPTMQALAIRTDAARLLEVVQLPKDQQQCYDALVDMVGGPLERVALGNGSIAIVHEEGLYTKERNLAATLFITTAVAEDGRQLIGDIHGTAVILSENVGDFAPIFTRELNRALALASIIGDPADG